MGLFKQALLEYQKRNIDLSASNSLFGSIGSSQLGLGTNYDFVPLDANGTIMDLNGSGIGTISAQWLGLSSKAMQFWAYNYCSPLAGVIDRLAEADSNGRVRFLDDDDNPYKNINKSPSLSRINRLFKTPNPLQSFYEFNGEQNVLCKIFGYCPVFMLYPEGMDGSYTTAMFNLNPFYWTPEYNYGYDMYDIESVSNGYIQSWNCSIQGKVYKIDARDILLMTDGFMQSSTTPGLPLSKLVGLDYIVSNICAAMEADNVLLKKKGPLGVFSYDAKPDMAGWQPMSNTMKNEVQDDLKRYGLTWAQLQYVVSKTPIKWNSMSFNVQELMTKETVRQGIEGICDRMGYPAELMSGKNATYENRNSAEKFLYQNNVIPFSLRTDDKYNHFFDLTHGVRICRDFNYLPVLKEDIMHAGQARQAESAALTMDWQNGIITYNEYRQSLELDTVDWGDILYNEYLKKYPAPVTKVQKPVKTKDNAPAPKN